MNMSANANQQAVINALQGLSDAVASVMSLTGPAVTTLSGQGMTEASAVVSNLATTLEPYATELVQLAATAQELGNLTNT